MEIEFKNNKIKLEKELNDLDKFVIDFTSILNKEQVIYVIVSGYVSILFGRNRASEDIDLIIEKIDLKKFQALFKELNRAFECITTEDPKKAYQEYLLNHTSIRFSYKGKYIPNVEVKFITKGLNQLDLLSLTERIEVQVNHHALFISPLELQIAFKVSLGSEKDIEDAVYLYEIFKDKLDKSLLREFGRKFNIVDKIGKYLP